MLIIAAWIVGGLIWAIGSLSTLHDILDHGTSMADYRKKYGHDLGMLICCTSRGATIAAWPIVGLGGFGFGIVRDSVRLLMGRGPKNIENNEK